MAYIIIGCVLLNIEKEKRQNICHKWKDKFQKLEYFVGRHLILTRPKLPHLTDISNSPKLEFPEILKPELPTLLKLELPEIPKPEFPHISKD
ncbi:hypothetical protein H5410_065021 [Solanum commersonii]|uniref:Uncharacterized protein n=1 Tax=Solanum commersonii TaxID=4109 RepID=A0A9J5VXQ5_SOLCO|nr:hypothetical protein H5410_065021 [Solanum commersonii]